MTPPAPDGQIFGPSESDIERAERAAIEPSSNRMPAFVWQLLASSIAIVAIAALLLNVLLPLFVAPSPERQVQTLTRATVVGVIDGVTLVVETPTGRHTVRYIGVEPPVPGSSSANHAADVNRGLVFGKDVLPESDKVDRDGDVLLRHVIIDETPVNLILVATGVARADLAGPNDRYRDLFRQLEQSARNQRLGIWATADGTERTF